MLLLKNIYIIYSQLQKSDFRKNFCGSREGVHLSASPLRGRRWKIATGYINYYKKLGINNYYSESDSCVRPHRQRERLWVASRNQSDVKPLGGSRNLNRNPLDGYAASECPRWILSAGLSYEAGSSRHHRIYDLSGG